MRTVRMKWKERIRESVVICRRNVLSEQLKDDLSRLKEGGALIFTDSAVFSLYQKQIEALGLPVSVMPSGEENKNERTLFTLLKEMAENGLRRNSTLIAIGGGVVGDVGGLAAGLYMRGISCIQVPTTLLAQVDSSVGGKTAIDFCGVKNLVGAFHQPMLVYADPSFFETLPEREIRCGLGEIVKYAALNGALFDKLMQNRQRLFDTEFLGEIVPETIGIKARIVQKDPNDTGIRRCLNLGHTTGHAIELTERNLSHGECVLLGLLYESRIARKYLETDGEYLDRLETLIGKISTCRPGKIDVENAARLALLDKKNTKEGSVSLAVPFKRGKYVFLELGYKDYVKDLKEIRSALC